ncbi:MAG: phosphatase PAP2 family protein [Terriglobia bacterium]
MSETFFVGLARAHPIPSVFDMRTRLSIAEQIAIAFFVYLTLAAFVLHLDAHDLCIIMALNTVTLATLIMLRRNRQRAPWLAAAADLFPALLVLVAYRESGLLLTPDPTHHLDNVFIQWDRVLLHNAFVQDVLQAGAPWLQHYLELAYLLCYPLVPLGVAAVHYAPPRSGAGEPAATKGGRAMDSYWAAVLLATLFCYAVYPFFPLTPPRVLVADVPGPHVAPLLRRLNFWLLDHYSVQACIFPSGHVAAVTAVALAVRKHAPRLGALFLFLAASVAVATVYGRYHYAADAVAGALVAVAAYIASNAMKPRAIE